jgi:tRNA-guanine transglycosylase
MGQEPNSIRSESKRARSPLLDRESKREKTSTGCPLSFDKIGSEKYARASVITLPHGQVQTPVFMPVGTYGAMKALPSKDLESMGPEIIMVNTYHLGNRPGADLLSDAGGLRKFMRWNKCQIHDSSGYQMVSLAKLLSLSEEGVEFESPVDGSKMLVTPEVSMQIQNCIGGDIMMVLDDVVSSTCTDMVRMKEATERTIRWLDRCIAAHARPTEQNLFAIVQGGLDPELREWSLTETIKRDTPGFAIGGLSGGEAKDAFWRVVSQCAKRLPDLKPRYVMGVGYPLDIVCCVSLGADMFDCVYPTRTARFGTALVPSGQMRLSNSVFKNDTRVIDPTCLCRGCSELKYSRAYLHPLAGKDPVAARIITEHNVVFMMNLMKQIRTAINENRFERFVCDFLLGMYPKAAKVNPPNWVRECLRDGAGMQSVEALYDWSDTECREGSDNPHVLE